MVTIGIYRPVFIKVKKKLESTHVGSITGDVLVTERYATNSNCLRSCTSVQM